MPFNTFSVATAVTPSVIETYFSHYLNRAPLRKKPTAHISYHEGLRLIRQFLDYSSKHTVEELQTFTAQWVPAPTWVRIQDCEVPPQFLQRSANTLRKQLGTAGIEKVGGEKWWTWRPQGSPLHAEWIEMKKDYNERRREGTKCERVILYVHGGAYYFGSVDEHRYQMQRHARKLKARVLAPRYRLAPQFPFPCGLHDCIATYFYLLEHFEPNQILFAGDSAGAGMILSMLVTLRDQGCPLPAGTILLSPWVDLTHSFPSVSGDGAGDYIPPAGFVHRPSMAWPPPPAEKIKRKFSQPIEQAFDVVELPATVDADLGKKPSRDNLRGEAQEPTKRGPQPSLKQTPGLSSTLEITLDGRATEIHDQIQIYTRNELLSHPLVSPVQQPSLGGLPPMLIQTGGGELLSDEQIYLAHKAANPRAYPPGEAILKEYDPHRTILNQYPPTDVQLQVWDDLCHVAHTLSFTRPAKYMYRSVAQFGAWALARAQQKGIEIQNDDAVSVISSGSEANGSQSTSSLSQRDTKESVGKDAARPSHASIRPIGSVGKAGDELPPFKDHMIRQRVDRHGMIFPLRPESEIASLHLDPASIGAIKSVPVRRWLAKKSEYEQRFENDYRKVQKKRAKEMAQGYDPMETGEVPPPSALVNRRRKGLAPAEKKKGKSWGLAMWSGWGSSHDESTLEREERANAQMGSESQSDLRSGSTVQSVSVQPDPAASASNLAVPSLNTEPESKSRRRLSGASGMSSPLSRDGSRPRSPYRKVTDAGQAGEVRSLDSMSRSGSFSQFTSSSRNQRFPPSGNSSSNLRSPGESVGVSSLIDDEVESKQSRLLAPTMSEAGKEGFKVPGSENTYLNPDSSRPHNGLVAYPFKIKKDAHITASPNPSTMTLDSTKELGMDSNGHSEPDVGKRGTKSSLSSDTRSKSPEAPAISPIEAPQSYGSSPAASKSRNVNSRDSRLGYLGPDGMPTAAFPFYSTRGSEPREEDPEAAGLNDAQADKPASFKVRNPVYDARTDKRRSGLFNAHQLPPGDPGEIAESVQKAPFKLRHTVYNPKFAPRSRTPSGEPELTVPSNEEPDVAQGTSTDTYANGTSAAFSNASAMRQLTGAPVSPSNGDDSDDEPPPPPPPKDNIKRKPAGSAASIPIVKHSTTASSTEGLRPGQDEQMKRPPLETFVTATEGLDSKRMEP